MIGAQTVSQTGFAVQAELSLLPLKILNHRNAGGCEPRESPLMDDIRSFFGGSKIYGGLIPPGKPGRLPLAAC